MKRILMLSVAMLVINYGVIRASGVSILIE